MCTDSHTTWIWVLKAKRVDAFISVIDVLNKHKLPCIVLDFYLVLARQRRSCITNVSNQRRWGKPLSTNETSSNQLLNKNHIVAVAWRALLQNTVHNFHK